MLPVYTVLQKYQKIQSQCSQGIVPILIRSLCKETLRGDMD